MRTLIIVLVSVFGINSAFAAANLCDSGIASASKMMADAKTTDQEAVNAAFAAMSQCISTVEAAESTIDAESGELMLTERGEQIGQVVEGSYVLCGKVEEKKKELATCLFGIAKLMQGFML